MIYNFPDVGARNFRRLEQTSLYRLIRMFHCKGFGQSNPIKTAYDNVAHHYDLSSNPYELFLAPDRQCSCAYFPDAETDLATVQLNKTAPGHKFIVNTEAKNS